MRGMLTAWCFLFGKLQTKDSVSSVQRLHVRCPPKETDEQKVEMKLHSMFWSVLVSVLLLGWTNRKQNQLWFVSDHVVFFVPDSLSERQTAWLGLTGECWHLFIYMYWHFEVDLLIDNKPQRELRNVSSIISQGWQGTTSFFFSQLSLMPRRI